jgi:hypothetical protein
VIALNGRAHCVLATLMPSGQPRSSLVWVDYDGDCARVSGPAPYPGARFRPGRERIRPCISSRTRTVNPPTFGVTAGTLPRALGIPTPWVQSSAASEPGGVVDQVSRRFEV